MGVGLLLHAPFGPAGVLRFALQGCVSQFKEHRAGGDRRGRCAAEECLRVAAVRDHIFEGAFLIVGVLLRLVDDEQVEALAQTALEERVRNSMRPSPLFSRMLSRPEARMDLYSILALSSRLHRRSHAA